MAKHFFACFNLVVNPLFSASHTQHLQEQEHSLPYYVVPTVTAPVLPFRHQTGILKSTSMCFVGTPPIY